jgi:hypothetical protein
MVDDPDGELRKQLTGALADLGRRLDTDDAARRSTRSPTRPAT